MKKKKIEISINTELSAKIVGRQKKTYSFQ